MKKLRLLFSITAILVSSFFASAHAFAQSVSSSGGPGATIGTVTPFDTSAIISGKIATQDLLVPVMITYGSINTILPGGKILIVGPTGTFSTEITGLQPSTKYYYQIVTSDSSGQAAISPMGSFVTLSTLLNLSTQNITQTTANIVGKISVSTPDMTIFFDQQGNGTFSTSYTPQVVTATDGSHGFTFQLTNLKPGHVYGYIAVKTSDQTTRLSGVRTFTTLEVVAAPYVSTITQSTATVSAKISAGATNPRVFWGTNQASLSGTANMTAGSDGTYSAQLAGLSANTPYFYQIVGDDDRIKPPLQYAGTYPYSGIFSFVTPAPASTTAAPTIQTIVDTLGGGSASGTASTGATAGGLVPCGNDGALTSAFKQACGFSMLVTLVSNVISFLLIVVAPLIATVVILYAGILILTSGGSTEAVTKARGMFSKAVIGLVIAMSAWLLIKTILVTVGVDPTAFPVFY